MRPGEDDPVLARAARSLQEAPADARWVDISDAIVSKVRATTRRTWPIDADYRTGAADTARAGDTLRVSDQVVRTAIRRALAGVHGGQPTAIDLYLDGHRCTGARIDIVGVYGDDLQAVGDELAGIALAVLRDVLGAGPQPLTRADIDVHVNDITET